MPRARSRANTNLFELKNSFKIKNSKKHVGKCSFIIVIYLVLVAIWIITDHHQTIELESDEQYNEEIDTFFSTFTRDCTSDHFLQWSSALVSLLIIPMFISILLVIAIGNMKKKASEREKLTILALINIVAISLIVLFAVLLANSFVVRKILISIGCFIVSLSNMINLKVRTKFN